ncbi:hypothetical protein CMI42_02185 [Candidatus Pacearchaeota archaeon]|jgi:hypothetical protein|nr:hypothetical protein [Candidatus Pacearchaeota archaeon]
MNNLIIQPNIDDKYDTEQIVDNIMYYDEKLEWVDIINNAGMMKSENEILNKKLYDRVFFLKDSYNPTEFKSTSRYMIYSFDDIEIKKKPWTKNIYQENLSLRLPNKWNWYSDSLTFDMISNVNNKVWNILTYMKINDDRHKFFALLNMLNIHIEQSYYEKV